MRSIRCRAAGLALAALGALSSLAQAQGYPAKPVKLIVPFSAGGSTDVVARLVGQKMGEGLGQPIVIENRPGAAGNLGVEAAARSPADGYTLVLVTVAYAINPAVYQKLPFDPAKDLTAVGLMASAPNMLVVHPSVPASNFAEFLALARQGGVFYASAGSGTPTHLAAELLNSVAGTQLTHVPYKGGSLAVNDLLGGQVKAMFAGIMTAMPYVKAGRLRAIAVTGPTRSRAAPDVPTIAESGFPGYEAMNWYALLAPAATPPAIIERLNRQLQVALQQPEVLEALARDGAEPERTTPQAAQAHIAAEIAKWRKIVQQAGVTPN